MRCVWVRLKSANPKKRQRPITLELVTAEKTRGRENRPNHGELAKMENAQMRAL